MNDFVAFRAGYSLMVIKNVLYVKTCTCTSLYIFALVATCASQSGKQLFPAFSNVFPRISECCHRNKRKQTWVPKCSVCCLYSIQDRKENHASQHVHLSSFSWDRHEHTHVHMLMSRGKTHTQAVPTSWPTGKPQEEKKKLFVEDTHSSVKQETERKRNWVQQQSVCTVM